MLHESRHIITQVRWLYMQPPLDFLNPPKHLPSVHVPTSLLVLWQVLVQGARYLSHPLICTLLLVRVSGA